MLGSLVVRTSSERRHPGASEGHQKEVRCAALQWNLLENCGRANRGREAAYDGCCSTNNCTKIVVYNMFLVTYNL